MLRLRLLRRIADCPAADWDRCADPAAAGRPDDPFVTHGFLSALEASGSVDPRAGWTPLHMLAEDAAGRVVAALPLYVKDHGRGEFVFDDAWAMALERAGGRYYPKLLGAVPFTPVTGRRILVAAGEPDWRREVTGAVFDRLAGLAGELGVASAHVNFCTGEEWETGAARGWLRREGLQLHWRNRGYGSFDEFLAELSARKRKQLRRERRRVQESGLRIETLAGDSLREAHWDALWQFYQDTGARNWGSPYLTRDFFHRVQAGLRRHVVLFLAFDGSRPVAGALHFRGREVLYGRYWGCVEQVPCLHFELCYYRAVEYAITEGLARVEAGAGGGHKIARGYDPVPTRSLHWFAHAGLAKAVAGYLDEEREMMQEQTASIAEAGSWRRGARQ